uniref:Myb-like domain-containing protein n=1 Tax=Coccidioides posadasii RMSCC 3488 TaxID=454284 RepID=A0A0J6FEH9_COCPO|nr:hypothetical protein CPAG_03644 [Coccidioides posadasii RMSCC 3488]
MAKSSKKNATENGTSSSGSQAKPQVKTPKQRPTTRTIVRWNDELDKQLLLSIQYACNAAGIKIPWGNVATLMGNNITEGAIVQHLAKLRARMEEEGIRVPPPLRRGGSGAAKKKGSSKATSTTKATSTDDDATKSQEPEMKVYPNKERQKSDVTSTRNRVDSSPSSVGEIGQPHPSDDSIAAGASFLEFAGIDKTAGSANNVVGGRKRKALDSSIVTLRISPWRLEKLLMKESRVIDKHRAGQQEAQASLGQDETVADSDETYQDMPCTQQMLLMETDAMDTESFLQIGAQHFEIPTECTCTQDSVGVSTQPLQTNDDLLQFYNPGYYNTAFSDMYLPGLTNRPLSTVQNPGLGSPQNDSFSWLMDSSAPNNRLLETEDNFDVAEFISPEYLTQ